MSAVLSVSREMVDMKDPGDGWSRPGAWPNSQGESDMLDRTCTVDGCDREPAARGWCMKHYLRWRAHGSPTVTLYARQERAPAQCSVVGCDRAAQSRGWCPKHYQRWKAHGTTADPETPQERFWAKVDKSGDCWIWTGQINPSGYGSFGYQNTSRTAHRLAYIWLVGPVDRSLDIDHLCHDPATCRLGVACPHRRCVNPAHLEAVSRRENTLRGGTFAADNARKTHCSKGHPFDEANTVMEYGKRRCRACIREKLRKRDKRRWAEHKARLLNTGGGV